MGVHIEKIERKKGTSYRSQIVIKDEGRIVHRQSKSFSTRRDAVSWGRRREKELQGALDDEQEFKRLTGVGSDQLLKDLIIRYQKEYSQRYGRTVGMDLDLLKRSDLSEQSIGKLRSGDIVRHVQQRLDSGVQPSTASNDLTRLHSVLEVAWAAWDIPGDYIAELAKARALCRKQRMVAKPQSRERLATADDLKKLIDHYESATRGDIPMAEIVRFAFYSCRRQDEITQLRWADCRKHGNEYLGVVPRLKDPSGQRFDVEFRYTPQAWDIAQRQPKTGELIFPYKAKSISSSFTRACQILGIDDLRFHDLRHNACTRLFKLGFQVHEVPLYSLHRSWVTLKRYTNLETRGLPLECP